MASDTENRSEPPPDNPTVVRPEIVDGIGRPGDGPGFAAPGADGSEGGTGPQGPDGGDAGEATESIAQPGKVLRIGTMVKQLLDEVRQAPLDEAGRQRLREIYEQSVRELSDGLSEDLVAELDRMAIPFGEAVPSEAELRIAQAQLVGWLEGLFHGIQAALVAQQVAARAQLDEMRQRALGPGSEPMTARPGTYL